MPNPRLHALALAALPIAVALMVPAKAAPDPMAAYTWNRRVLLVSAPTAQDAAAVAQRAIYRDMQAGARERDLALVEALGGTPTARALRAKFDLPSDRFRVLLVGKDGGEKLSSATPLGPARLFPTIDAMPMRQGEMRRRP